jgi:hypothetical protein
MLAADSRKSTDFLVYFICCFCRFLNEKRLDKKHRGLHGLIRHCMAYSIAVQASVASPNADPSIF